MTGFIDVISFGNPRNCALICGAFSVAQFVIELIGILCISVYVVSMPIVIKVFFAIAALSIPIFLCISVAYLIAIEKANCTWIRVWLLSLVIVTVSELVLSLIAFLHLNGFHSIFQFYASAWTLAQLHTADQLFVGVQNETTCTRLSNVFLIDSADSVRYAAFVSQMGAGGVIACAAILLLIKNIFNIFALLVCYAHYSDVTNGNGRRRNYLSRNTSFHMDPHNRPQQKRVQFSRNLKTVSS